MKQENDEGRLDELIARATDIGKVEFDRTQWLARLAAPGPGLDSRYRRIAKSQPRKRIWRTIMESRIARYSVAATILVAACVVLFAPLGGRHGVALAEVVERMNEVRTIRHKEDRVYYEAGKEEPMLRAKVVKYVSFDRGVVEEQYNEAGDLMYRVYILKDPPQIILVFPEEKTYLKLPLADSWANLMNSLTPKAIIEHVKSGDYQDLGPATVDGQEVEGFAANNPGIWPIPERYWFLFPVKNIRWQFWIATDRDLPLPAAVDLEVTTGRGFFTLFKELRITCHGYDMEYDQDIPSTVFDPNIPADYTSLNLESPLKENAAWLGIGGLPVGLLVYRGRRRRRRLHARALSR